uniref:Peptidase M23B n=1 Tax=Caulobacter sp. (strain K31) TaxID=366602 RepID=B0T7Q1_CAUSK
MKRDLQSGVWLSSAVAAVFAVAATAHVTGVKAPPPIRPPAALAPGQTRTDLAGQDLAAAIRDNAPLPVLLSSAPATSAGSLVVPQTRVIEGPVEDVLYGRPDGDPVETAAVTKALALFSHRLDLTRDVALGDRVRLVVGQPAFGAGASKGDLDYAELDGATGRVRLYRDDSGTVPRYIDEAGVDLERFLLRTPLRITRITSGFGPRLHPLLGYTRMHRGVDLAAPIGTPVLAAGDGVVEAVGWDGGYGRRILLRHADGYETLYGHLSAAGPAAEVGARVRQGQVIGWTGVSGQATGPHLHFEVRLHRVAVDPATARPASPATTRDQVDAFEARKRAIAEVLAAKAQAPRVIAAASGAAQRAL